MEGNPENSMEEIRGSLVTIVGEQNSKLTKVTKNYKGVMSSMSDELCELIKKDN